MIDSLGRYLGAHVAHFRPAFDPLNGGAAVRAMGEGPAHGPKVFAPSFMATGQVL